MLALSCFAWPLNSCAQAPGSEDWSPAAVEADLAKSPKVERLCLDTWLGKGWNRSGMDVGLGLVLPWKKIRPGLQVAPDRAGFCLGYRLVPILDITVGINGTWDLRTGSLEPGIYLSVFRF